ncbi:MAG TPA: hypothetical protein VM943_02170, partial [Pyrinomonadaceae bacterium]|nr:hypothetical protein [Pyrinomonadaceae bacterium]
RWVVWPAPPRVCNLLVRFVSIEIFLTSLRALNIREERAGMYKACPAILSRTFFNPPCRTNYITDGTVFPEAERNYLI